MLDDTANLVIHLVEIRDVWWPLIWVNKRWRFLLQKSSSVVGSVCESAVLLEDQLVGQAKRCGTKIQPKAVGVGIFGRFSNFGKCRSEVAGDVISGLAVD